MYSMALGPRDLGPRRRFVASVVDGQTAERWTSLGLQWMAARAHLIRGQYRHMAERWTATRMHATQVVRRMQ